MKKLIIEFIGTFFLVLVIGMVGYQQVLFQSPQMLAPIGIGAILMVMVYMGGPVSGAHYNPAVTLGILLRKKIAAGDAIKYMLVQLIGALAAAVVFFIIFKTTMGTVAPNGGFNYNLKPLLIEMLFTFALVTVVLHVATTQKAAGNSYYGLAIGFTVMAGAIAAGPYSGGAFNPAVTLGPMIMDAIKGGSSLGNAWFYLVGQFAGGALAAWIFGMTNPDEMM
jgi:aquaporin Z